MILTTQKNYEFTLPEKIRIAGLHVETARKFKQEIVSGKLRLSDNWNIQIVSAPAAAPAQAELSLLEFPVLWEDEFEWTQGCPGDHLIFSYKKAPRSISAHIREEKRDVLLDLTLEAVIGWEIGRSADPPPAPRPAGAWEEKIGALEEKVCVLSEAFRNLELEVQKLKEEQLARPVLKCRLAGTILDDFRMGPVPKSILEFFPNGSPEACAKTAADNQGYYSCEELAPGSYEIKIKHPRFLPLVIKDFTIKAGENKYQDFILRRA